MQQTRGAILNEWRSIKHLGIGATRSSSHTNKPMGAQHTCWLTQLIKHVGPYVRACRGLSYMLGQWYLRCHVGADVMGCTCSWGACVSPWKVYITMIFRIKLTWGGKFQVVRCILTESACMDKNPTIPHQTQNTKQTHD